MKIVCFGNFAGVVECENDKIHLLIDIGEIN
jgi:hypothetical protein